MAGRTARKHRVAKVALREDEQHLRRSGKVLQKNYSIIKNKRIVGNVILDFDLKAYPDNWDTKHLKKSDLGIASIHVDNEYRSKGIGSKILKKLTTVARKSKRKRLVLVVYDWNSRAKKFYKKEGFEPVGTSKYQGKRDQKKHKTVIVMAKKV